MALDFLKKLALVAPGMAMRRLEALNAIEMRSAYEGAKQGRRGSTFGNAGGSANNALAGSMGRLRDRSRDMVRNTWIAARVIDILTAHTIGAGIKCTFKTGSKAKDKQLRIAFKNWENRADIEGLLDFRGLQMVAFRAMLEGGEALIRMIPRRYSADQPVAFGLKVLEADFLDESRDGPIDNLRTRLGVALGDFDERLGYFIHSEHPGERRLGTPLRSGFMDKSEIIHLFRPLRPGMVRGVPLLAPVLMTMRDYADLIDSVIVKAKTEACFAAFVKTNESLKSIGASVQANQGQAPGSTPGEPLDSLRPGTINYLGNGQEITFAQPSSSGGFADVSLNTLMGLAAGCGLTYDQLTGDLRQANYSSLRAGKIEFRRLVEQLQYLVVVPILLRPVLERFVREAIISGQFNGKPQDVTFDYIMPANEPIDPLKDTKADRDNVRMARMSPQELIQGYGKDWEEVVNDHAEFWKVIDNLGLKLDIDGRQMTQAGMAQPDNSGSEL